MKQMKKAACLLAAMVMLVMTSLTAYASPLRWDALVVIAANMEIDENWATIDVTCEGDYRKVDELKVKCELQQYDGSWKTIKSWEESDEDSYITYTKNYGVYKNYSYRLKITARAYWEGSQIESATEYFPYGYYN